MIKRTTQTIETQTKNQRSVFLTVLLDTVGAILLENVLSSKGAIWPGDGVNRAGIGMNLNSKVYIDKTICQTRRGIGPT